MNAKNNLIIGSLSAFVMAGSMLLPLESFAQEARAEEMQVLTRGPVHEAFAESVSFDPVAGIIVTSRPPEGIEELPPEHELEGDNVTWISGYWAWDDDQNDFIWISGIWRNLPPGRQWVPGYWNEIEDGQSQWTSGYWADAEQAEVSYIATAPPRNIDSGPNVDAPSEDHNWIPGNWMWADTRYAWRPGYWAPQRTNWTWVPSRYNWSRRGYIHVDGYWDYAVARRGVLFAPVYFNNRSYARPDYYYTPSIVVGLNVFSSHLFIRPRSCHYYFGDYYAPRYRESGFHSSFSWHSGRHGYDPIYAYDRWDHRSDSGWERRRHDEFNYFRDHEDARPAHTWAAMRDYRDDRFNDGRNRAYATPLASYSKDSKNGQRFRNLDDGRRKQFVSQRQDMRKFSQDRRQTESRANTPEDKSRKSASVEKITRSPIRGKDADRFAKSEAPPKRLEGRGDKSRIVPSNKDKSKAEIARKDDPKNSKGPSERANDRASDRGVTNRDDEARDKDKNRDKDKTATPGKNQENKPGNSGKNEKSEREMPRQNDNATKDANKPKSQEREDKTKNEIRPTPERKNPEVKQRENQPKSQAREIPKREAQPKPQAKETQKREVQPKPQARENQKREAQPKSQNRTAPERKPQAEPKRESQPKPMVRENKSRESQPKAQSRPAPERKQQATPKREAPKPQARPTPQRKAEPAQQRESKPQSRPAPQRSAQPEPQRKAQSEPKKNPKSDEEAKDKKRKDSKE